jgi:hypothetical protein
MKAYRGRRSTHPSIFTLALDAVEWFSSRPGRFILGEKTPGIQPIGDRVGQRATLEFSKKNHLPLLASEPWNARATA